MKQYKGKNAKFQRSFDGYEIGLVAAILTEDVTSAEMPYLGRVHDEDIREIKRNEDTEPEPVDCLEAIAKIPSLVFEYA